MLYGPLFIGNTSGSLGETSVVALLIGGIYLAFRKRVHLEIPLIYIGNLFRNRLDYWLN